MAYRVKLKNFEGPLDLLLFLIKKNEVDIYDIPVADITRQYLEYVDILQLLDLEGASEFILLAATLIRIKAKMLLPRPKPEDDDDIIDPRLELVTRLLEYKRFKEVAYKFGELEEERSKLFNRRYFEEIEDKSSEGLELGENVSLFSLIATFQRVLDQMPKESFHHVEDIQITLDEQIDYILQFKSESKQISFYKLISSLKDRLIVIVTFMAVLELMRRGEITARQSTPFGEIWIVRQRDRI
ncbi:segregation/condensation protein A [candidate division KSB1 bacterium]|nr:segregation/condensation protein A [candidate division KSB1 bacterium]